MTTRSPSSATPTDGAARAERYARAVVAGSVPACVYVRQACLRFVRELDEGCPGYTFSASHANRAIRFIEALPHIKGAKFSRKRLQLQDWQCFIVANIFGWVDAEGNRRFKTVYVEVPRKNGKSTLASGIALYCAFADGEPGAEVYSAATTRDQAKIVWEDAKRMVERTPALQSHMGVEVSAHSIFQPKTACFFKALSRDNQGNLDGLNVHAAIVDEIHAHKDRAIWDVLETATGARTQPLLFGITTAGFNRMGVCYELRTYLIKLLNGVAEDPEFFGIVYTIDATDDWTTPEAWQKANPNYGISVSPEDLARKARKAQEMASAQNNFLTKHLNVWVNAGQAWMNMTAWEALADRSLSEQQFTGEDCLIALDLATRTDIAAKIKLFRRQIDGREHFYVFATHYVPESAVGGTQADDDEKPDTKRNDFYAGWAEEGWLTVTPGEVNDFELIENEVYEDARLYQVVDIAVDPWQAAAMMQNFIKKRLPVVEYPNTVRNMSDPMKLLEALVLDGRLHHNGDPVLAWMMSNVVCHIDAKDNIYPRKEQPKNKIDAVVALIMAIGRSGVAKKAESSYWQTEEALIVLS